MLSLATLLLKDIENILQYLFMFLLFVTPIGFFPESLSAKLKLVVYLNPVFYLIRPFQDLLVYNQLPSPTVSLVATLISLLVFVLGSRFFRAFKAVAYEFI
jgi:lipopolysaccharide transport system permease protein